MKGGGRTYAVDINVIEIIRVVGSSALAIVLRTHFKEILANVSVRAAVRDLQRAGITVNGVTALSDLVGLDLLLYEYDGAASVMVKDIPSSATGRYPLNPSLGS